ncbi:MAG: cadherin-like beta sandwich domain-containing protein [Sphingobacteriales bacterium]
MKKIFTTTNLVTVMLFLLGLTFSAGAQDLEKTLQTNVGGTAMTKDASGNVYVIESITNPDSFVGGNAYKGEIVKYSAGSSTGTVLTGTTVIPYTDGESTDDYPFGIAIDSHGNIFVTTYNDYNPTNGGDAAFYGNILKFTPNGGGGYNESTWVTGAWNGSNAGIGDFGALVVDSHDNLFVTAFDQGANGGSGAYVLVEYPSGSTSPSEKYIHLGDNQLASGDSYSSFTAMTIDASDNIYVATNFDVNNASDGGKIIELSKAGGYTSASAAIATNPYCSALAMDATGNLYATTTTSSFLTYSLVEFANATGSPATLYTNGILGDNFGNYYPFGLAVDPDNIIYATSGQMHTGSTDLGDVVQLIGPVTTQAQNINFSSTGATGTTINWTNGNGAFRAVFMAQASTGTPAPVNSTDYTANANFTSGSQIGASGWYCVYNGTGVSVAVTGLTAAKTYRVMVLEYNGLNGSADEDYLTTTATNNPNNVNTLSTDATLSNLTASSGAFDQIFASGTTSYTQTVPYTTSGITVTPTTSNINATVTVNGTPVTSGSASGTISLSVGPNTITVTGKAQDGVTTDPYTLTVTRTAPASIASLSHIVVNPGVKITRQGTTLNYTGTVNYTTSSVTITPTTANPTAIVTVNGTPVTSGTASGSINLNAGSNTITLVSTAQDGVTTFTYSVIITRGEFLSGITPGIGYISPVFAGGTTAYTESVGNLTTGITLTPTAGDPTAVITVNGTPVTSGTASGNIPLTVGANAIPVVITSADNLASTTYTVTVTRIKSANAALSHIILSPATALTQTTPGILNYTGSVKYATASVTVTPTTADPTATVTVNGTPVTSGTASGSISLNVGANTITLVGTAPDGVTTKTYTVIVTRATGPEANLAAVISVAQPSINLNIENDGILVHQGLSPNGDGVNDFLMIDGITAYPENRLTIINRNGTLVYQAQGYDNTSKVFDGHSTKTGAMQVPGTYFYALDYSVNGVIKHQTGFIILKY